MFRGLTYRNKNRLLLAAGIVVGMIIYSKPLKKTFLLYEEYEHLRELNTVAEDAPKKVEQLKHKLATMDIALGGSRNEDSENVQQQLLGAITRYCQSNALILREFPKTQSNRQNDIEVETNVFIVEGNFKKLLELVYLLEQKERIGKPVSVSFQSKQDSKTKKLALTAAIYVQNVKK